jgi:hypothetical protein
MRSRNRKTWDEIRESGQEVEDLVLASYRRTVVPNLKASF